MATITYIGAGTTATAVNASVTPTFHASTTTGDLVLIHASIRNSGAGTVDLPAGWASLVDFGNQRIMGRIGQPGDTPPTITFTGGVAGADTIAQCATWRGVSAEVLSALTASITQLNASAANIAYPGLTVPKDRHVVIAAAWKQDDATAYSTPATMSSAGTVLNLIAGNDASQAWFYVIQTAAANIAGGTITVTGGAAAISRAVLLALKPAATVTVTEQDVWPPRVLISVTDLTLGDSVAVYRSVGGVRTAVRAGADAAVIDVAFLVIDAELPFGIPVSYVVSVNGVEYATAAVTYTLPGGKVALTDAITGSSAEVVIRAWPERSYARQASTFVAGGRNIAVLGPMAGFTGTVEVYVDTTSSVESVFDLIDAATQGIIQIRQPGGYDRIDCYVAVLAVRERRSSQDGTDERRFIALDLLEVESWAPTLEAAGFTYADLDAAYTGLTYAALAGDYTTYLQLAQADLS